MRDLPTTFSLTQRILHWLMVALILFNLLLPQGMGGAGLDLGFYPAPALHIAAGSAVLVLGLMRLAIRLSEKVPPEPAGAPRFFRGFARLGQWMFYALFLAMPLSGMLAWYGFDDSARFLHGQVLRPLFWALIAIHVGLALAHQFVWKTDMLGKILRG